MDGICASPCACFIRQEIAANRFDPSSDRTVLELRSNPLNGCVWLHDPRSSQSNCPLRRSTGSSRLSSSPADGIRAIATSAVDFEHCVGVTIERDQEFISAEMIEVSRDPDECVRAKVQLADVRDGFLQGIPLDQAFPDTGAARHPQEYRKTSTENRRL